MRLAWYPAKRASNIAKHGVDFAQAEYFDWSSALVQADLRQHYAEVRLIALGLIGTRVHVLVFASGATKPGSSAYEGLRERRRFYAAQG